MGEAVSKNFNRYVECSAHAPWELEVEPFRCAPDIYYVGNEWVGSFLINTRTDGLILLDTCVFENVYLTIEMIRKCGFDPHDIRHIMLTHCHCDHVGGLRALKELSGAKVWMSAEDDAFRFHPANTALDDVFYIAPYDVDEHFDHTAPMQFGAVTIRTILTPGHTPGTTSFFITSKGDDGTELTAGMHGGVGPMTMKKDYLEQYGLPLSLQQDFVDGCDALKNEQVDIALASHPSHGNLLGRVGEDRMDYKTFIDGKIWADFLEERKQFVVEMMKGEK